MDPPSSKPESNAEQVDSLWFKFGKEKAPSTNEYAIPIANRTELYYPMRGSPNRGKCFVLNFQEFTIDQPVRSGSEHDVTALEQTFKALGFEYEVKHNLTKRSTLDYLNYGKTVLKKKYIF